MKKNKKFINDKYNDVVDKYFSISKEYLSRFYASSIPYFRRVLRFIALPYAYFILVNWKECTSSPFQVFKDFIYIFFILKDFPDYYIQFRWWEIDRSEWKFYYGSFYNPYQRGRLRKEIQKKEYEILFEDKYISSQLCIAADIAQPEFLGYIEPKDHYHQLLDKLVEKHQRVIIKSTRGRGGKDIYLAYKQNGETVINDRFQIKSLDHFILEYPSILQKYITQHKLVNNISVSVNTIRTETLLTHDNNVLILGSFMRFGLNNTFVDNQSSGGLSVGVNIETGKLKKYALDGRGKQYTAHPDSGFVFENFQIPFWEEIVNLSKRVQTSFPYYKILGPDIAITDTGPIIIEINAIPDHAGLEMDYGPTLKNDQVLIEFHKYNLLINKPIKRVIMEKELV